MITENERPRDDWFSRFGWAVVLTATLSMSAYSLFYVGRHLGMPWYFAAIVSLCFDGVAVLAADYSLRYARMGLTATGPQMTVFLFGGLSAYLNTLHAYFGHEIPIAKVLWAAPPVAAILVFEFHTKWERLSALRAANRVAEALPPLGRPSWMHHPIASLRAIRAISGERLTVILEREAPRAVQRAMEDKARREQESEDERIAREAEEIEAELRNAAGNKAALIRIAIRRNPALEAPEIGAWLDIQGYPDVSDAYVRTVKSNDSRRVVEAKRSNVHALPNAGNAS
jgi:hypothetical protein